MCPADDLNPKFKTEWAGSGAGDSAWTQGFHGNYLVCAGNDYFNPGGTNGSLNLNGMFYARSTVKLTDVSDGTSNTAMVCEIVLSPDAPAHDIRGRYYNPAHSGVSFSTRVPPNTLVPDQFNWCGSNTNPRAPCIETNTNIFVSARSYHFAGVNMALGDGTVRFISNSVDPNVYKALGSRNGNEGGGDF